MKSKTTRRIMALTCAMMMTASASASVFANDGGGEGMGGMGGQPGQTMMNEQAPPMQDANQNESAQPPTMPEQYSQQNDNAQPPAAPEQNGQQNDNVQPPAMPEQNGQQNGNGSLQPSDMNAQPAGPNNDMPERREGEQPKGTKEGNDALSRITDLASDAKKTITGLISEYNSAVDTERESTDESEKITAAGLVKTLMDKINAALEAAGLSFRISVPSDKPSVPAKSGAASAETPASAAGSNNTPAGNSDTPAA